MQTAYDLSGLLALSPAGAVHAATIGNFDGVHLGHQALLARTREKARGTGALSLAVTFEPHPLRLLRGIELPDLLTDLPRKLELLEEHGMDRVLVLPFTHELAALTPEEFSRAILKDALNISGLVIGYDYALGRNRRGDYALLAQLGAGLGFDVERLPPLRAGEDIVSSSLIRLRLRQGDVRGAGALLGRPHSVDGLVVRGRGQGGTLLGFPTANLSLGEVLLPKGGVYAVLARILPAEKSGRCFAAVANVGVNPTFGGNKLSLEAHLLNFSGDLYGRKLRLHFMERLRDETRFPCVEALKRQIGQDAAAAKALLVERSGCPNHDELTQALSK
jgi:riboflavin kinase/FMN adenylyltransferase